jgi:DDE family transposase
MLAGITRIVEQFKQSWSGELEGEAIRAACQEAGHEWRDRKLDPVTTVRLFLLQILWGNTACNHVPRLAGMKLTGSAYCEARGRLPLEVLQTLLTRCTSRMSECVRETGRWLGHRLFMLDGSSFSMPDTEELQTHFGQPGGQKKGCGFPTAHWLALVHFGSGLIQKVVPTPLRTSDLSGVSQLHPELEKNDVLLGDRAFCSFAHLALLLAGGLHAILRSHQKLIVNFTPGRPHVGHSGGKAGAKKGQPRSRWIKKLGHQDQIVEWFKGLKAPDWMSAETWATLPVSFVVRELRYRIARPGFRVREVTLVTTLLNAEIYTKSDLAEAYGLRWNIETCFAHLKTTMKMDVLRCQTVSGVMKELTMFLLVYNMVRMVMLEASKRQKVPVDRISFVDALRWLANAKPGDELPELVVNPSRPGRYEPRACKRRPKQYDLLNKPRAVLREELLQKSLAA